MISETYAKDSKATQQEQALRSLCEVLPLGRRTGSRAATGSSASSPTTAFVDQIAFDGMRKHLIRTSHSIYHVDLHGNVRKNPKLSGTTHNVFGIQVGVGITVAVRRRRQATKRCCLSPSAGVLAEGRKVGVAGRARTLSGVTWQSLKPDDRQHLACA